MDGEARPLRIKNLWGSKGNLKCLDCREVIVEGLPFWNVFQDGIWVGVAHSLDGKCRNSHNPIEDKDEKHSQEV